MATTLIPTVSAGRTIANSSEVRLEVETHGGQAHTLILTPASAKTIGVMLCNAVLTVERARLDLPNPRPTLIGEPA